MPYTLDTITLDVDPDNYQPLDIRRRGSIVPLVDGGTLIQDRGYKVTDGIIQLSGKSADVNVITGLIALQRVRGKTFTLADDKNCAYTVCFSPNQGFAWKPIPGSQLGFTYSMVLCVISVDKWFGTEDGFPSES